MPNCWIYSSKNTFQDWGNNHIIFLKSFRNVIIQIYPTLYFHLTSIMSYFSWCFGFPGISFRPHRSANDHRSCGYFQRIIESFLKTSRIPLSQELWVCEFNLNWPGQRPQFSIPAAFMVFCSIVFKFLSPINTLECSIFLNPRNIISYQLTF